MTDYNEKLSQYIADRFAPQDAALRRALTETPQRGLPAISIQPAEGRFLQFLARACGAKRALEIGTLGGYSGIWIARGLVEAGRLISLEKSPEHAAVAREHFEAAGVAGRVEVRVGDAHETLKSLAAEAPLDFVFIDAEKSGYDRYYEWAMANVRLGGVIAAHNALRHGAVFDPANDEPDTLSMRAFNDRAAADPRGFSTLFPGGDGTVVTVRVA